MATRLVHPLRWLQAFTISAPQYSWDVRQRQLTPKRGVQIIVFFGCGAHDAHPLRVSKVESGYDQDDYSCIYAL